MVGFNSVQMVKFLFTLKTIKKQLYSQLENFQPCWLHYRTFRVNLSLLKQYLQYCDHSRHVGDLLSGQTNLNTAGGGRLLQ